MPKIDPDKERQLRQRQEKLTALANHPSWPTLKESFEAKKNSHLNMIAAELLGEDPINQRQLDWIRGYWQGCSWLLANPGMAEHSLEAALKKARTLEEDG
jgi:hypothetical protein